MNYVEFQGKDLEESAWCSMPFDPEGMDKTPLYFTVASTILYFLVPFTIVFVLYTRIGLEMKAGGIFLFNVWGENEIMYTGTYKSF